MKKKNLSKEEAIAIALHAQGFGKSFGKGKAGALKTIRYLGYVQLDTLAVVARAHHHTKMYRRWAKKHCAFYQPSIHFSL
ncbi:MAG: hypothetical protein M3R17_09245 [Bacteroidota bacterium]|nr:hypothetical protein [Bacteroidota bacterium]